MILVMGTTFPRWTGDTLPPFVFELSKRLNEFEKCVVLAPMAEGSEEHEVMDGLEVHRFKYPFMKFAKFGEGAILPLIKQNKFRWFTVPFFVVWQFFAMRNLMKKYEFDKVHAHWIIPQGFIAVVYKTFFKKGLKVLVTSHGGDIYGFNKGFLKRVKRWVLNKCSSLTVVSNAMKDEALNIGFKSDIPVRVIPMGVDLLKFKEFDGEREDLLFVGRLSEKKGVKYLIGAMPKILERFPTLKLNIIGDGEEKKNLINLSQSLNLENNVKFLGPKKNEELPQYYNQSLMFVGPSIITGSGDREGFGLVFVEALGSGCITVSSDLPQISDIIVEGVTGYTVEQNSSDSISDKVCWIMNNLETAKKVSCDGRQNAIEKFDWKIITKKYYEVLK